MGEAPGFRETPHQPRPPALKGLRPQRVESDGACRPALELGGRKAAIIAPRDEPDGTDSQFPFHADRKIDCRRCRWQLKKSAASRFRCVPKTPRTLRDGGSEMACQTLVCMFSSLNSTISGRVAGGKPFAAGESEDPQAQTEVALVKTRWRLGGAGLPLEETRSYL